MEGQGGAGRGRAPGGGQGSAQHQGPAPPRRSPCPALPHFPPSLPNNNNNNNALPYLQAARKIHIAKFRAGRVRCLIVTDVAARGLDIPLLDNVVNYGGWVGGCQGCV